uniref:Uncharacterized protein n=1 Tax=Lactuca sativa TaxID=4236 RepID=A0A9R1VVI9_LACSA|nr:hypothetical protein LSAT_V11C400204070 [Lactuca sativa]
MIQNLILKVVVHQRRQKKESPIKKEKKTNDVHQSHYITIYNPWVERKTKKCVRSMGFGSLLKMKITDIPLRMGFYILQKFDSERMMIDVEGKELKVTAQSVHDMLGIPKCGTKLIQLDQWPKDDTRSIIRLNVIKKVIVSTREADFNFKLNFLVLFVITCCESTSMGRCNLFP